jgi:hypothetical protein
MVAESSMKRTASSEFMISKGFAKTGVDVPVDSGRALKTCALTTTAAEALKVARADMDRLWRAARRHPFLPSKNS